MNTSHEILPDGESTEKWAINEPGFIGSIRQLIACARCGGELEIKSVHAKRHMRDILKPTHHTICDACYGELPE